MRDNISTDQSLYTIQKVSVPLSPGTVLLLQSMLRESLQNSEDDHDLAGSRLRHVKF